MKITIQAEDFEGDNVPFNFSDDELNNDNSIDLELYDDDGLITEYTLSVDDLYFAIKTFRDMREERLKLDKLRD